MAADVAVAWIAVPSWRKIDGKISNDARMERKSVVVVHWRSTGKVEAYSSLVGFCAAHPQYAPHRIYSRWKDGIYVDFRNFLGRIPLSPRERQLAYVYADPPYLDTANNYGNASQWTERDTRDLFSTLVSSGLRFALSEFDHPVVVQLAIDHGLYVHDLGERKNLGNRRTELLITNTVHNINTVERVSGTLHAASSVGFAGYHQHSVDRRALQRGGSP